MQTFTPREYLKIDISNSYGNDKQSWDDRIAWFDANEPNLEKLTSSAETPATYFAGVLAWRDVNNGIASGYPISLDSTASGTQLMACLTGDTEAAKLCNVINTGKREDAYTAIYEHMLLALKQQGNIKRNDVKRAVMTANYGSEAVPKEVFGEGKQLEAFYTAMEKLAPYVWQLNKAFLSIWDPKAIIHSWVMPDNFHVHIKVMGQVVDTVQFLNEPYEIIRKVNKPKESGRSLGANCIHAVDGFIVREMARRCSFNKEQVDSAFLFLVQNGRDVALDSDGFTLNDDDKMLLTLWEHYKSSGFLSARILDHITANNARYVDRSVVVELIESLPSKSFELLSIHDCWRVLPSYGNDLRKQYINQLALISKSNMLSFLISQIIQRPVELGKADEDMWKQVLDSEYALS